MTVKKYSVGEFRERLSDIANEAFYREKPAILVRYGKELGAFVPMSAYDRWVNQPATGTATFSMSARPEGTLIAAARGKTKGHNVASRKRADAPLTVTAGGARSRT